MKRGPQGPVVDYPDFKAAMRRAAIRMCREEIAEEQTEILESLYGRWVRTAQMRDFLGVLEDRIADDARWPGKEAWLEWARRYIDSIDPLSDTALAELFAAAKAVAPNSIDDEPWDGEEQEWRDMGWLGQLLDEDEDLVREAYGLDSPPEGRPRTHGDETP